MGGTESAELAMDQQDFDSFPPLERYMREVADSRTATRGPVYVNPEKHEYDRATATLYHNFRMGAAMEQGARQCYGVREKRSDGTAGEYRWITYKEVLERSIAVAAGLTQFAKLERQDHVGFFSKNCLEWALCSHACDRQAMVVVPLYDTLGVDAVPYVMNQAGVRLLLCAREQFDAVMACHEACTALEYVVQFEEVTDKQRLQAEENGLQLQSFAEIEAFGRAHPIPEDPPTPDDISTLCYTSGTTGNPKGVIILHSNITFVCSYMLEHLELTAEDTHFSYLPLPHVFERTVLQLVTRSGARTGFFQGDMTKLMDDAVTLQPTLFFSVPRLFNRIVSKIRDGVEAAGGIKKQLFDYAYESKRQRLHQGGGPHHAFWDALVFGKLQAILGGRVRLMVSGSAPLTPEVKECLQIVFSCDLLEGYAMTENCCGLSIPTKHMRLGAHVGTVIPNVQMRLEDVPEMDYTSRDKPRPRGEVLCRGDSVFAGYYMEPKLTADAIDKDGWFHTGDIGCWNADGTMSIIDRRKNFFKLSQGEYVAVEKIENVYIQSKYLAQLFVDGKSTEHCLVAIGVPEPEVAERWAHAQKGKYQDGADLDYQAILRDSQFQADVLADMTAVAKTACLRGFEMIRKLHLVPNAFTVEDNLVTPTFKLKRPQLRACFHTEIDRMYDEIHAAETRKAT